MKEVAFLIIVLLSATNVYSDLIILNSGREIESNNIWEEDEYIAYTKYGTVIKIDKDRVREIIRTKTQEKDVDNIKKK